MLRYKGGCSELSRDYGIEQKCCGSCHEDNELGYEDLLEVDEDESVEDRGYYVVCCKMDLIFTKNTQLRRRGPLG